MDVASDKASPVLDIRIYFPMPAMRMLFSRARSYLGAHYALSTTLVNFAKISHMI